MMRTTIAPLNEHIYILRDELNSTAYLVVGTNRAVLIDTLDALDDLRPIVASVTLLPVVVINTHGHPDHVAGNIFFGHGKMNCAEWPIAKRFFRNQEKAIKDMGFPLPSCEPLNPGDRFDLGNVELEAIPCQGHTPGGICLLDRTDRTLFSGDSINMHLWMQLRESTGLPSLIQSLDALTPYREAFDTILHGHAEGFVPADIIDRLRAGALEIIEGHTESDKDYHYFGRTAKQHVYMPDGALIVYRKKSWWNRK